MRILIAAMIVMICLLPGCKGSDVSTSSAPKVRQVVIGLIPEQNIFHQIERYQPLADYLSSKLDLDVKLKVIPGYGNLINNFSSSGVDGAFFGSFTYVLAHEKLGVEVLVRPEYSDGTSTYHGLIFVRKSSGIRSVKEMKGKIFAFVDKSTTAGYLLPLEYFHEHGIKNYRSYLKEVYYAGTHEDAVFDVLNGKADIGAAKNTIYEKLAAEHGRVEGELRIITRSPDVPENGLAVRKDLDASVKEKLKQGLLDMDKTDEGRKVLKQFGAARFIETIDKDYESVYRYAGEIGLDLKSFRVSER